MAPRRRFDRAPLDSRSYRDPLDRRMERYNGYDVRDDGHRRGNEPRRPTFRPHRRAVRSGQRLCCNEARLADDPDRSGTDGWRNWTPILSQEPIAFYGPAEPTDVAIVTNLRDRIL